MTAITSSKTTAGKPYTAAWTLREANSKIATLSVVYTETERSILIHTRQLNLQQLCLSEQPTTTTFLEDGRSFKTLVQKLRKYVTVLRKYERKLRSLKTIDSDLLEEIWDLKAIKFEPGADQSLDTLGYLVEYDINDLCFPTKRNHAVDKRSTGPHSPQKIELHQEILSSSPSAPNLVSLSSGFHSYGSCGGSQVSLVSETDCTARRDLRLQPRSDFSTGEQSHVTDQSRAFKLIWSLPVVAEHKPSAKQEMGVVEDVAFLPGGNLITSNSANHQLQLYSNSGQHIGVLGQHKLTKLLGDWQFKPQCVATTAASHSKIYVTDQQDNCIKEFDVYSGRCVASIPIVNYSHPYGLAVLDNDQFVVTHCDDFLTIHDRTGATVRTIRSDGNLCYVCCDKRNRILTTDTSSNCVRIFDTTGKEIQRFSLDMPNDTTLGYPQGICVDRTGRIYVADSLHSRVCQFTADGVYLNTVLSEKDNIHWPRGLAIDGDKLAVTSQSGVSVYDIPTSGSSRFLSTYL